MTEQHTYEPIAVKIVEGAQAILDRAEQVMMMKEQWGKPFAALGNFFTQNETELQKTFNESKLAHMEPGDLKEVLHFFGVIDISELQIKSSSYSTKNSPGLKYYYSISGKGRSVSYLPAAYYLEMRAATSDAERFVTTELKHNPVDQVVTDVRTVRTVSSLGPKKRPQDTIRISMELGKNSEPIGGILTKFEDGDFKNIENPDSWGQPDQSLKSLLASK